MSLERALAPLVVALAAIAIVVWLLLVNDLVLGPWLLAGLVLAHGWVHLMFVFPKPESPAREVDGMGYPFDFARSWLVTRRGLELKVVSRAGVVIMGVTFALSVLAALSTLGVLVPTAWWAALMVGTATGSAVLLALFYSPALVLGFVIDALIVALVVSGMWSPA